MPFEYYIAYGADGRMYVQRVDTAEEALWSEKNLERTVGFWMSAEQVEYTLRLAKLVGISHEQSIAAWLASYLIKQPPVPAGVVVGFDENGKPEIRRKENVESSKSVGDNEDLREKAYDWITKS